MQATRKRKTLWVVLMLEVCFNKVRVKEPWELITGKHGSVYSKYKAEVTDITLDAKTVKKTTQKVPEVLFFLFHYKPLVRPCSEHCSVLGTWPETFMFWS